ncbi:hypothetical protein Peur_053222 [Populus x canadensis]
MQTAITRKSGGLAVSKIQKKTLNVPTNKVQVVDSKKTNFFHILVCYYLLHVSLNKQAAQKGKVIFSYKHTRKRKNKTVLPSKVFAVVVTERHN